MAINPIQKATIEIGNIISADSLSCGISDSSNGNTGILDYKVYDINSKLDFIIDNNFYYVSSFVDLKSNLNEYKTGSAQISHGSIISGNGTYDWLEYCYEQLSRLRYCKFYYKNSEYERTAIFSEIPYTKISADIVLLSDNKLSMAKTENNDVPYDNNISNFIKIDGGISASYNFATKYHLDKFTGVNELSNQFKRGEIIYSKTVNDTIDKYHSIFVLNGVDSNGSKLSCVFSNAPGFNCKDDNYKIFLHFTLHAFTSWNDAKSKFSFAGDSRIFDNAQFNNLQLNGSAFIKKYLYENVEFSMSNLGITNINFANDYKIRGWFCVRTNSDNISNAITELKNYVKININSNTVNIEEEDNIFQYYTYDNVLINDNNFNEICDKTININLGNNDEERIHYWLFPYMTGETVGDNYYCPLNNYAPNGGKNNYKKTNLDDAVKILSKEQKLENTTLDTPYYGIVFEDNKWKYITTKENLKKYKNKLPYDTYPISKILYIYSYVRYRGKYSDSTWKSDSVTFAKGIPLQGGGVLNNDTTYTLVKPIRLDNIKINLEVYENSNLKSTINLTTDAVDSYKQGFVANGNQGQWDPNKPAKNVPLSRGLTFKRQDWTSGQDTTAHVTLNSYNKETNYIKIVRNFLDSEIESGTGSESTSSDTTKTFANAVIKTYQIISYPQI